MKKKLSFMLAVIMAVSAVCGYMLPSASAAYTLPGSGTVEKIIKSTGIMTGDANGNMNLGKSVTRAEFAKLLVAASSYKDSVSIGSGSSPFKDVKSTHWASDYIKTAVDAGWLTGYLDGTYRPDNTVLLEEAASAILKLLGYTAEDYTGSYPNAQISKFTALGLTTGISAGQGSPLTRNECMYIFFNLLSAKQKSGTVYGTALGYTTDSEGYFDYESYVDDKREGPLVLTGGTLDSKLPFGADSAEVYRNGKPSELSAAAMYDVYYYNPITETVWIYSDKVIGLYTAVAPNKVSPTSITVGGNSYELGTDAAKQKVSSTGGFAYGETVAILLGMNGEVVDIIEAGLVDTTYYGIVTLLDVVTYSTGTGKSTVEYLATVACTDGVERQFTGSSYLTAGTLVSVSYKNGVSEMKRLSIKTVSGTVNATATKLGDYTLSEDIEIMEVSGDGAWTTLYPGRLSGVTVTGCVQHYLLNSRGEIELLILKDLTGDMCTYGVISSVKETVTEPTDGSFPTANGAYTFVLDGKTQTLNTSGTHLGIEVGAGRFVYKDGAISRIINLNRVYLGEISSAQMTAVGGDKKFEVSEDVQVYLYSNGSHYLTELSAISDTSAYSVYGYYESDYPAGGQLRIIVATKK